MGLSIFDESAPYWKVTERANATGTGRQALVVASPGRIRIDAIWVYTTAAANHDCLLEVFDAVSNRALAVVSVPLLSGTAGVPIVNLLELLPATFVALVLPPGFTLSATYAVTLGAAEIADFHVVGGSL
jgi:hypothetical protein